MTTELLMKEAIKEARKALRKKEVPIGAIIVKDGEIISRGYNLRETKQDSILHAEIIAIRKACKKLGTWRLEDCDLFVTLEPCPMCAGAILQSRIRSVYFGAYDSKGGAGGSLINILENNCFNHSSKVFGGILKEECSLLLTDFFKEIRQAKN